MHTIQLTLLFAGLCTLLQCLLAAMVIARRKQTGILLMDGGNQTLQRRIRALGNFSETAPMALLLMALLELKGLGTAWILTFGFSLLAGRLLHAYGLVVIDATPSPLPIRLIGMVLTLAVLSIEAAWCIWYYFQ
jgi:uncharacterized membrane protein YecN with MAPEG domain